jgi:hypothetical protein
VHLATINLFALFVSIAMVKAGNFKNKRLDFTILAKNYDLKIYLIIFTKKKYFKSASFLIFF